MRSHRDRVYGKRRESSQGLLLADSSLLAGKFHSPISGFLFPKGASRELLKVFLPYKKNEIIRQLSVFLLVEEPYAPFGINHVPIMNMYYVYLLLQRTK